MSAEFLDAVADLVAVQAEQRAGPRLVAAAAPERLDDQASLELLEVDARRRQLELVAGADGLVPAQRNRCASSRSPSDSSIARSMTLRSSRTLPGQP